MTHTPYSASSEIQSIAQDSAPLFALKWSAAGTAIALCLMMAGCDSFAPKETPRYNTVVGERRLPVMNAEMLSGNAAQQAVPVPIVEQSPMPVPMVAPTAPIASAPPAPAAQSPTTDNDMMVSQAAPRETIPTSPPQVTSEPSMIDQLSGVFSENPETAGLTYPTLPPSDQAQQPAPPPASMEAEMQALERDLIAAQQQQQQTVTPPAFVPTSTPNLTQQPLPEEAFAAQATPQQPLPWEGKEDDGYMMQPVAPKLLPPPPAAPAYVAPPMQPAPTEAAATASFAAAPQSYVPAPDMVAPSPAYDIPMTPPVYAAPQAAMPYGLTPPSSAGAYGENFLPPSRYQGRRLHSQ